MDKANPQFNNVEQYIASLPEEVQVIFNKLRNEIKSLHPEITENIRYQMPGFELHGKYLIYIGAWKKHIGLYSIDFGNNGELDKKLSEYKGTKDSLRLPFNKPIPYEMVQKLVKLKVRDVLNKSKA